ncbi:MAG: hypothetical protein ACPGVO_04465 [Spirulinaceae cyanobacterium]
MTTSQRLTSEQEREILSTQFPHLHWWEISKSDWIGIHPKIEGYVLILSYWDLENEGKAWSGVLYDDWDKSNYTDWCWDEPIPNVDISLFAGDYSPTINEAISKLKTNLAVVSQFAGVTSAGANVSQL